MAQNKLKIGLVLDDGLDKPDGVQQYILGIGGWLQSQGHEVQYLVGQTERKDIPGVHSMSRNIGWRFNGNRGTMPLPANKTAIKQLLAQEQFDILHVQVPYSPFLAHRLIRQTPQTTAVIGTFHVAPSGRLMTAGTYLLGRALRSSLGRFDTMLSVSPTAARFAKNTFGVASDVLPNVLNYPLFHTARPLENYEDALPTVLFLGRLVPRKGCKLLLEAVAVLRQSHPALAFRVVICGRGSLEGSLKEFVAEHDLGDIVEFTGFISEADKPRYYASADIAVFPSCGGESFGIVLLEAMASGNAAVLAGDNPGYRSVLEPKPGLLFDPYDAQQLADLLYKYLTDLHMRKQMAAWGSEYTRQFDVDVVGRKLVAIYREVLQKRSNQ